MASHATSIWFTQLLLGLKGNYWVSLAVLCMLLLSGRWKSARYQPERWLLGATEAHGQSWFVLLVQLGAFPKVLIVTGEEKRENSTESGSKGGELLLGSRSSLPCSCKVLSTKELQGSIKSALDCQGQHSSLTICVPKVKHVLNEARVLCLGQSWILNSSVFCSFLLKKWGCCFLASWDILKTSSLEVSKSNEQKENVTYQRIRFRVINFPTYCEPGVPVAFTSCAGKKKRRKKCKKIELCDASDTLNVIVPLNPCL